MVAFSGTAGGCIFAGEGTQSGLIASRMAAPAIPVTAAMENPVRVRSRIYHRKGFTRANVIET